MTVQEIIDNLQKIENKDLPVCFAKICFARGSSRTGMYECGTEPILIESVKICEGDDLAGVNDLDKIDHIELFNE